MTEPAGRTRQPYASIATHTVDAPRVDRPECGWFRTKLVRGGVWVPARIWMEPPVDPVTGEPMDRPPMMCAEIAGKLAIPETVWPRVMGQRITEAEWNYLSGIKAWAEQNAPGSLEAQPTKAIDFNATPSIF